VGEPSVVPAKFLVGRTPSANPAGAATATSSGFPVRTQETTPPTTAPAHDANFPHATGDRSLTTSPPPNPSAPAPTAPGGAAASTSNDGPGGQRRGGLTSTQVGMTVGVSIGVMLILLLAWHLYRSTAEARRRSPRGGAFNPFRRRDVHELEQQAGMSEADGGRPPRCELEAVSAGAAAAAVTVMAVTRANREDGHSIRGGKVSPLSPPVEGSVHKGEKPKGEKRKSWRRGAMLKTRSMPVSPEDWRATLNVAEPLPAQLGPKRGDALHEKETK
jgi:hypothetical protein